MRVTKSSTWAWPVATSTETSGIDSEITTPGQIVNMFAQYLFLARVQFIPEKRITHPRDAKAACHAYIRDRCSFSWRVTSDGAAARKMENALKAELQPTLNP